ncbi:MAG: thioredoxin domain-containing protein, partial [Chloroflexi bacterium]|nr:thioredoxin domain-containing protein [Chloroflexota bacterium]
ETDSANNGADSANSEADSGMAISDDEKEYDASGVEVGFTEDGHPYRGNPDAPIVLEEFSDYQCPFCARFYSQTLPSIEENQIANGEVVLIFYDFPLTNLHPQAVAAANAARCAGEQSVAAYWSMHDLIFANDSVWAHAGANAAFSGYAEQLDLDVAQFDECQTSLKFSDDIQADLNLGRSRGVSSTPSFFVNNQPLVGAQPLSAFNQAIAAAGAGEPIADAQPDAQPEAAPPSQPAPTPASIPTDNGAIALGDPNAPVTLVEYTDYQCPFCQRHSQETMPSMIAEMIETGRVYYIMKDFPLDSLHPDARAASAAARCAGDQDAYWEMHDAIFDNQSNWAGQGAVTVLSGLAAELGLDVDVYDECVSSGKYDDAVQANLEEGAALGVSATPYFFLNGFPVRGAIPFERFEIGIGMAEDGTLADAYKPSEAVPQPTAVPEPSEPVDVPIDGTFALGDPDAPVVMVEYTDFQCPFCVRHHQQTFPQIKSNFIDNGLVYYVFKDFPLTSIHPQAVAAAEAARCAGDQEAYVEMHGMLFNTQGAWSGQPNTTELFAGYAGQLGLDTAVFTQCMESGQHQAAVQADLQEGASFGVRGTPAFFINGNFVSGAQPYSAFEGAINGLLNQ